MNRKALLAMVFAGGMLNSQLPALSETESKAEGRTESTDSVEQEITNNIDLPPAIRAFILLRFASDYLTNSNRSYVEAKFARMANDRSLNWIFRDPKRAEGIFVAWAEQLASERHCINHDVSAETEAKPPPQSTGVENSALADAAIRKALKQLDNSSETFAKLNIYFIASQLFQKSGNTAGMQECNNVLEEAFKSCEVKASADEAQIKALSSILNSMAYGFIPIHIWDLDLKEKPWERQNEVKPLTEKEFRESKKFKLKSIALVDKLPPDSHVRRKAHRDLVLWYIQLGKNEMAEEEKQVLFELVGTKDDSILYPQQGTCGHLVWWVREGRAGGPFCGMG